VGKLPLTPDQIRRFARQVLIPQIAGPGQARILAATVLLHGDAPLCATYLAAGGLGRLRVHGTIPDVAAHEPAFQLEPGGPGDPADLVVDLGDGAAHAAAVGPALRGGFDAAGELVLGTEPLDPGTGEAGVAARALLETLAAGEALRMLAGGEVHCYRFRPT